MKRRMDSDEKYGGGKRSSLDTKGNNNTHLKRQLENFTSVIVVTKVTLCKKKRLVDAAVVATVIVVEAEAIATTTEVAENIRPAKLSARRSSPLQSSATFNPLQCASSGTTSRMASLIKFVPTPGFKTPRKKT
ncbi:hypothetical protein Ahy_B03g066465 [Arachis hypogaea]|uniref:Uncharacterized protein n=1 Tax=Arachis hypogaea TaxID=3818 RepID=A0A445A4B0_ARAHY|nr:hypothetical protein Ahy_B03g066465 [Arachis hypogaea]